MNVMPHSRRIDPSRRAAAHTLRTDGNPAEAEWAEAGLRAPDMDLIRGYRLDRLRAHLKAEDVSGILLGDMMNLRYALDATNMQIWCMHNAVRYGFVATEGPAILWDFHGCEHLSDHLPLISERRPALSYMHMMAGPREPEIAALWAREIADLVRAHGGGSRRLAVDVLDPVGAAALEAEGIEIVPALRLCDEARKIKHREEIVAMRRAIHATERSMAAMWHALEPGMTENQLWSVLHGESIARGAEWIETRLLASGPRTNPWFAECADRVIQAGDVVAFDTDLIGPYGYCADLSRSWITPGRTPTDEQRRLHGHAVDMIAHNIELMRPGLSFEEFSARSYALPDSMIGQRYSVVMHGVGLCDEFPCVRYPQDWELYGYDYLFEPGMVMCVEAYIGEDGGHEGIKIERQVLVTESGTEILDDFPLDLVPEI